MLGCIPSPRCCRPEQSSAVLRREQVATLAGISSAYYLRLGQGRDTHPPEQVVEALARALRRDLKATEYLHRLATGMGSRRRQSAEDTVADTQLSIIWRS